MRTAFVVALATVALAGPSSTSNSKGNPHQANYDPMARHQPSYRYDYVHGQDITGMHANAHHHAKTVYMSMDDLAGAMEDAGEEAPALPENCAEDAAIDCVGAFVDAGCPAEGYEGAEECADYAACNAEPGLCMEVVMAEGEEEVEELEAAMGLDRNPVGYSQFRCDPAGRGVLNDDGSCTCDEGANIVVVGTVATAHIFRGSHETGGVAKSAARDTAAGSSALGNPQPAYYTCLPDVASAPRPLPQEGDAEEPQAEGSSAAAIATVAALFAAVSL